MRIKTLGNGVSYMREREHSLRIELSLSEMKGGGRYIEKDWFAQGVVGSNILRANYYREGNMEVE